MKRLSTTFFLTCAFLLCSAISAWAIPTVNITNLKHACGGQANGSFTINVTGASGSQLKVRVFGPPGFTDIDQTFTPLPAQPFTFQVNNAPGSTDPAGEEYIVIVTDGTGNRTVFVYVYDFTVTLTSVTQNTNPGCASPNGAIDVTLNGSSPSGTVTYTWTGPGGPYTTQDISNLAGGDYNLSYTDGTTTCSLGPIHINDPSATPFTISAASSSVCEGSAFAVNVSTADNGYTYTVLEGATVIASAAGAGGPLSINVPAQPAGTHTYTVRATAGVCPPRSNDAPDLTITVNPAPDYNNYNNDSSPGGICSNTALGINLTTLKKASSVTATSFNITAISSTGLTATAGSPATGVITPTDLADDQWKNTTNGNLDVIYTIQTLAGTCPGNTITVRVTIKPQPDYNSYSNDLLPGGVCSRTAIGVTLDPLKKSTSVLATSYNITSINSLGLTAVGGSPAPGVGLPSAQIADDQWQNVTNVPHDVVYTIVPVISGCIGDPFTVRVTINPQPDYNIYNNNNFPGGICSQDPLNIDLATLAKASSIAATTFNITGIASTGLTAVGGSPAAGTGLAANVIADDQWKNVTNIDRNVVYNIVPVVGSCQGNSFTVTVTIHPQPDYNNYLNNNAPSICSDGLIGVDLLSLKKATSVAATTYNITSITSTGLTATAGSPATGTGLPASEIADDKWKNITTGSLNVVYTIQPVTGTCVGDPFTVTVTVDPQPDYNNYADDNAPGGICSSDAIGLDLATLKKATSVAATAYDITSIVSTNLTAGAGAPSTGTNLTSNVIADDSWINNTSVAHTVTYTIVPKTGTCSGDPFTVVVTINPRPDYNNYDNDLSPGGICASALGIDLSTLKKASSIAATSFDITNISATGLTSAGGTPTVGTGFTATEISDDVWSNVTASPIDVIYTIVPNAGTCAGNPFTVKVTIKSQPDYASAPVVQCSSVALGFDFSSVKSGPSVTATSFNITNITIPAGVTATAGSPAVANGVASNEIANDVWQNLTNAPLDVIYTITPFAGTCAGASFTITATINPEPVYSNSTLPDICSADVVGLDLSTLKAATSVSATTFDFTTSAGALTPVGTTVASGSGNATVIADDQWKNTTNAAITLVYTITPKTGSGCVGVPFTVTVNVNPQPDYNNYNNDLAPSGVCSSPLAIDLSTLKKATSVGATTFNITNIASASLTSIAGSPAVANGVTSTDLADDVWQNVTSTPHDVVYTIVPVIGTCVGDPFTVTVTILPSPDYNNSTPVVCSDVATGVDLSALKKASSVAATTYNITSINSGGLTASGGAPAPGNGLPANVIADDKWTNVTAAAVNVVYTVVPVAGSCAGAPFTVTVTINPEPLGVNFSKSICSGDNVSVDLQTAGIDPGNAIASTTFSWIAADNTSVTGESTTTQSTGTINDALVNTTSVDQIVVYTVVPTSPLGCVGDPFSLSVTVSPKPVLVVGQTAQVCSGSSVGYEILLNPANLPVGTTFSWPDPDGSGPATAGVNVPQGGGGIPHINDVLVNLSAAPLNVTYVVTPSIGGTCVGTPQNVVIVVNQAPLVEAGPNQAICTDNGAYTLAGSSISGSASNATWSFGTTPAGHDGVLSNTAAVTNPASVTFTATVPGDYQLILTTDDPPGVCGPAVDIVVITVTPKPVITPGQTKLVCANDPIAYEIQMTPAGLPLNTVFNWPDPDGSGPAQAGVNVPIGPSGTFHINDVLINNGTSNINVTYVVTPSVGLCTGLPESIVISVKPSPVVAFGQTKTICSGDFVDYEILLTPANMPAGTTFSWPDPDGAGPATSQVNIPADPAGTPHIKDQLFNGTGAPIHVIYSVISRGANGCNGVTRDIDIIVNPGAVVEAGNPQTVCSNGTVTLTGSSIGGLATNGTWTIASSPVGGDGVITNGNATTTPASATFTATVGGDYQLVLTTDDPAGSCVAVSDAVTITVKSPGDPSCTGGTGTCSTVSIVPVPTPATCSNSDGKVFFNITPPMPITGDVKITIDGTGSTTLPSPRTNFASVDGYEFDVLATGTYTYTIEYGDASCTKTGVFSIDRSGTVGLPTATPTIDPTCFGGTGTAIIDAPGQTGINLEWSADGAVWSPFIGGGPATGLPAGSNLIFVRRPGDPCAGAVTIDFPAVAQINATVTPTNATCSNDNGKIALENLTGGTAPYSFALNGAQVAAPANNTFTLLTSDTYTIKVTDVNGCSRDFGPIEITYPGPTSSVDTLYVHKKISYPDLATGSAVVGVLPSGFDPYETRLELTTPNPAFPSQVFASDWKEVALNNQNLKFEQSYSDLYAGEYTLGIRDAIGCEKYFLFTIDVDVNLFIPNIFTPNKDGYNDVFYIRNLPTDAKLLITNRWGNEVYKTSAYQNDWGGGDAVDGMYYYTLSIGSQKYTGWVEILRAQ